MNKNTQDTQIDIHKLQAESQVGNAMLQAQMAEFEAERKAKAIAEQEERENLIAEAYKMAGKIEAFKFMSSFADIGSFTLLKKIKESKVYKEMPTIKTWDNFCKSIGLSRSKVDEDLENISIFGEKFIADIGNFGLGYRELRTLRKQAKEGEIEVRDTEVVINGEVIPVDDKDTLREALDYLLETKYEEIKTLKKDNKEKEEEIKQLQNANALFLKDRQEAINELEHIKGIGVFNGIEVEENNDFSKIKEVENEIDTLNFHLHTIINTPDLSDMNKKFLGGVVVKAMNVINEFHELLVKLDIQQFYGDAFVPDEMIEAYEYDKLETPVEYQRRININKEDSEEKEIKITVKASNE